MVSRKTAYEDYYFRRTEESPGVCVVHSQDSAGKTFVYFSGCQRPENRLEKLQDICKWRPIKPADSPNRMEDSFSKVPEELKPEHGYH